MKNIKEKLRNLKVLFLDADGVFFDGRETRAVTNEGVIVSKTRHFIDGQGLCFMRELGIRIVFVTGEGEPLDSLVGKFNALPSAKSGRWAPIEIFSNENSNKLGVIKVWLEKNKIDKADAVYMGDDVNDFQSMKEISKEGLTVAPANATRKILPLADIVTKKTGGNGAIREFAEMVLDARGKDESDFPPP